jgi:hypothetical protein
MWEIAVAVLAAANITLYEPGYNMTKLHVVAVDYPLGRASVLYH